MICRVAAHYGLTDLQILAMPIKRFWLFSESIDRMKAADDLRAMQVASSVLSNEAYGRSTERLTDLVGTVVVKDYEREEGAAQKLLSLMNK